MKNFDYDVIVIWSGSGGLTVSIWLASAGKRVALVEKWLLWWDCTNTWCVPSKAFIDIAKSWKHKDIKTILEKVRMRRKVIQDEETIEKIESYGMKIFKWFASFEDKNTVLIDDKDKITAKNIVISTGSSARTFPIEGIDKKEILTNENVFEIKENIKDLVVMWWWYIWCELAESFANAWVNVTIIQRNTKLIPREEEESSILIRKIFEDKGIKVFTDTTIEKVEWNKIIAVDKITKEKIEIKFDKILQALWRWANVWNLWLEKININFSNRGIKVNKYNQTNIKNIFAIWDCVEWNPMFTHWANNEGRWVIRNIIIPFIKSSTRNAILPATLYTNIEVSRVWKTEEELLKYYTEDDFITKIIYFDTNDRSILTEDTLWFIKINFKRISWKILWATIVWNRAGEMLPILTNAMQNNISAYKIAKIIYSYPTKSELIKKVCDSFVIWTLSNIKLEMKYFIKNNAPQIVTWVIWLLIAFFYFYFKNLYNLSNLEIAKIIYSFVSTSFWWPILYITLYAFRPLIFFPATFMSFMSWAIFWIVGGLFFTIIWENLAANLAYLIGKIFWKNIIKPESSWLLIDFKNKVNDNAFLSILTTRLLFLPFDLINYISWVLKIKWRGFFLWTLIWTIPGSLIFVLAWSSVENVWSFDFSKISIDFKTMVISVILFVASLGLAKILKKKGF